MSTPAPLERRIARLLVGQEARGGSGILKATRGKLRRLFCVAGGRLAFAASNVVEEQLGETLRRKGLLSDAASAVAREATGKERRALSSILLEEQLVPERGLRTALEGLVEELLFSTMGWPDGAADFAEGKPNLEGEVTVALSPLALVLRYAKRHPPKLDEVRGRIGNPGLRLRRAGRALEMAGPAQLDALSRALLERCDGGASVSELLKPSAASEGEALRALHGLILAGLLVPSDEAGRERAHEPPLTLEECQARLTSAEGMDHYTVLGLERGAPRDKVREAYYAIARRYHPDRFRSGEMQGLLPRFEVFFTAVTQAYNTLWNPEARAYYDAQLDPAGRIEGPRLSDTAQTARQNYLRGRALLEMKRWSEATTFLENAVQLDPGQAEYQLELGRVLIRNPRRRDDAERHLRKAVELEPAKAAAFIALAQLYKVQGRWAESLEALTEALRWEPDDAEAASLLAELRAASK